MSTRLRLFLPATWPAQHHDCDWWLFDATGQRLQQGHSEPRHWPPASHCEVVLSADQCLPHAVDLPRNARARTPDAIGYALEEQLLADSDAEHLVIGERLSTISQDASHASLQRYAVWVIRRSRLDVLLSTLRNLDRQPLRIISELQLPPLTHAANWSVVLHAQSGHVRIANEMGYCFDRLPPTASTGPAQPLATDDDSSEAVPVELQLALTSARAQGQAPEALTLYEARDAALSDASLAAWQDTLQIPVHRVDMQIDWRAAPASTARNLLTGEFAPAGSRHPGWSVLRPAAWLAAASLLLYGGYSLSSWFWLSQQKNTLQQQMKANFQAVFPQAQAIIDPPLQMQRLYDQLRHERGQLGDQDFLPLLTTLTQSLPQGTQLQSLDYADGRLETTLQLANQHDALDLQRRMEQRGLRVIVKNTQPQGSDVLVSLALQRTV